MIPIGPLMREHRLIERMVETIKHELTKISEQKEIDSNFIDVAVDFFKTYADRCHHGKEEDILFKELTTKPLKENHQKIMNELIKEHIHARKTVTNLKKASNKPGHSEKKGIIEICELLKEITLIYPKHIEKEDKHFFYPCMEYFSKPELDNMLQNFWEFDRQLIHQKYEKIVAEKEHKTVNPKLVIDNQQKWECTVCGYIYDPRKGDPEHGINSGINFEELPEDWVCPICFAQKRAFKEKS